MDQALVLSSLMDRSSMRDAAVVAPSLGMVSVSESAEQQRNRLPAGVSVTSVVKILPRSLQDAALESIPLLVAHALSFSMPKTRIAEMALMIANRFGVEIQDVVDQVWREIEDSRVVRFCESAERLGTGLVDGDPHMTVASLDALMKHALDGVTGINALPIPVGYRNFGELMFVPTQEVVATALRMYGGGAGSRVFPTAVDVPSTGEGIAQYAAGLQEQSGVRPTDVPAPGAPLFWAALTQQQKLAFASSVGAPVWFSLALRNAMSVHDALMAYPRPGVANAALAVPCLWKKITRVMTTTQATSIAKLFDPELFDRSRESGGPEEGFFPLLAAALPMLSSILPGAASMMGSMGGGLAGMLAQLMGSSPNVSEVEQSRTAPQAKKAAGGGGFLSSILSKLPLGRMLVGGKGGSGGLFSMFKGGPTLRNAGPFEVLMSMGERGGPTMNRVAAELDRVVQEAMDDEEEEGGDDDETGGVDAGANSGAPIDPLVGM